MSLGPFRSNSTIENVVLPEINGQVSRNGGKNRSALEGSLQGGGMSKLSVKRNTTFAISPMQS
jgi:hypothetical protein